MKLYAQNGEKDAFKNELGRIQKKLGLDRAFSRYLIAHDFGGVAYRSTRMALIGL